MVYHILYLCESRLYRNKVTNIQPFQALQRTHIHKNLRRTFVYSFVRFVNIHFEYSRCVNTPHTHSVYYNNVYSSKYYINVIRKLYLKYVQNRRQTRRRTTKLTREEKNEIKVGQSNWYDWASKWRLQIMRISSRIADKLRMDISIRTSLSISDHFDLFLQNLTYTLFIQMQCVHVSFETEAFAVN